MFVLEDLLPYTQYTLQVAAVQSDGRDGERSAQIKITTPEDCEEGGGGEKEGEAIFLFCLVPGPPANVYVMEIAGNFINVSWEHPTSPNGVITGT